MRHCRQHQLICAALALLLISPFAVAQEPQRNFNGDYSRIGPGQNQSFDATPSANATGNTGGAANADFDSLMDLIVSTVAPDTWAENGGGQAEIRPFPTGVLVDAPGTLKLVTSTPATELTATRAAAAQLSVDGHAESTVAGSHLNHPRSNPRRPSHLRCISLPRLEQEIIRRQAAHEPFDSALLALAGLQRIQYIFLYPDTGDVVLAGPAGDWAVDLQGRIRSVSADQPGAGRPIVRLDDLLTLLRRAQQSSASFFGCTINPRPAALAATQAYLDKTSPHPLQPSRRDAWLDKLRTTLGQQDVEIFGIDPTSHVARVLVEADIHMKLVGMGLADGTPGVENYLDSVKNSQRAGASPPPSMSVLRWWFALHYAAIRTSPSGNAYELVGDGARVLSENELLAAQGQRVHTGQSDPLNQKFADSFTAHFAALTDKYPVYGELRTIFDLALVVALLDADKLADRAHWKPTRLLDQEKLRLPQWPIPREVVTVANYVEVNRRQLIAGVSGGVMVDTKATLANRTAASPVAESLRDSIFSAATQNSEPITWWWDATE